MSFTKLKYPSAFASEGNPSAGGGLPGDFDPYVHGANDTMDVDDSTGHFSLDVSLVFRSHSGFPANIRSIWQGLRSSQLPLRWSKVGGIIPGDESLITWDYAICVLPYVSAEGLYLVKLPRGSDVNAVRLGCS